MMNECWQAIEGDWSHLRGTTHGFIDKCQVAASQWSQHLQFGATSIRRYRNIKVVGAQVEQESSRSQLYLLVYLNFGGSMNPLYLPVVRPYNLDPPIQSTAHLLAIISSIRQCAFHSHLTNSYFSPSVVWSSTWPVSTKKCLWNLIILLISIYCFYLHHTNHHSKKNILSI